MRALNVPSVGVAVVTDGRIAWSRDFGSERDAKPLYQAASMSKFVAAVVALRLVEAGVLSLDAPVDATLRSFKTARPPLTDGHPVILRRLLAMRAGIGVPGFLGYDPGAPLPTLAEILDGTPPAKSPAVRVVARPGSRYAYSGRVLMKRGQNIGFQGYLILFPETGQGMVVMTGSDNGTTLAEALIRRAAEVYGWPALGHLGD
jgi:CubicO group peptidase (beta-lactamase class C family)